MKFTFGYIVWMVLAGLRFLGIIGVAGLIAYPFGILRNYIWMWLAFLVIGIFMAKLISDTEQDLIKGKR